MEKRLAYTLQTCVIFIGLVKTYDNVPLKLRTMVGYERQEVKEIYIQAVNTVYPATTRQHQEHYQLLLGQLKVYNRDVKLHTLHKINLNGALEQWNENVVVWTHQSIATHKNY